MEMIQYYDAGRYTAMSDVYCVAIGTVLGSLAGFVIKSESSFPWLRKISARPFVVMLLASWLSYRLYPFVPVIDLHKYWDAVKPLLFNPQVSGLSVSQHAISWLAVALLLEDLLGTVRGRWATIMLFPAVLFLRILIDGIELSPSEVCGGALALLIWNLAISRFRGRTILVAALFAGTVVLQGLEPFQFSSVARPFGWVPFVSFLKGPLNTAIASFFNKVFTYGCLIWLLARAGFSPRMSAVLGGALVFGIRLTQVYLPGRSAEITDLIMLLLIAGIMQLLSEDPREAVMAPRARP